MDQYTISPLQEDQAVLLTGWRYSSPYNVYDLSPNDLSGLMNPVYRYHQVMDQSGNLIGYCCFGEDAQVEGGNYLPSEPEILDVGVGMHPELVGRGLGEGFVREILIYG